MDNLDFSHGGNIYKAVRKYKKELIDFSANINPLGLPPGIKKAIYKNFERTLHYPDPEAKDITRKIAEYWNIKERNILVGNGSAELIYLIMSAYRPRTTLIPAPTFSEYERAAKSVQSKIRFLKPEDKKDFAFDLSRLTSSDILFLCNPNNPRGNLIVKNSARIEKLPNRLVVVDEAFMDFVSGERTYTLIRRAPKSKKIIVLRTLTKFFALPGLRIGYLVAHKDIIDTLRRHQAPWSVNVLAQLAAKAALGDKKYIKKSGRLIKRERNFVFKAITGIEGLVPYPSVANFLLIKITDKRIFSSDLAKRLAKKGILIRDCANFRGLNNKFIRIAVRSRGENRKLITALKEVIGG